MVLCTKMDSSVFRRIGNILTIYRFSNTNFEKCNDNFYCDKNNNSAFCPHYNILPLFSLQDYYYEDNAELLFFRKTYNLAISLGANIILVRIIMDNYGDFSVTAKIIIVWIVAVTFL